MYTMYIYNSVCNIKVPHHLRHRSPLPLIRYASVQVHRGWQSHKSVCIHSIKNRLFKFQNVLRSVITVVNSRATGKHYILYTYSVYIPIIRICVSIHVAYNTYTVYYAYIICMVVKTIE